MITTTYRFIAFEIGWGNYSAVNQVFNVSLIIHLCLAVLLILFAETLGKYYIYNFLNVPSHQINDALFVFRFSIWGTFFTIISIPYQGLITAQENFLIRATISIIRVVLQLCAVLLIVGYLGNQLRLYSVLIMFTMIVPAILFFTYSRYKYNSITQWNFQRNWSKYREMIGFSGWIMLGAGATIGKSQGSALIINAFFGTILNATYGIANQVNMLVTMFSQNLGQAAIPQITKSYSGGNFKRSTDLAIYITKYSFFLMLLLAFPIILELDFILKLWLKIVPEYTSIFIKLMIIYALIESMNAGISTVIQASGKIKWFQIINSTILLLSLPIAYALFTLGFKPYAIIVVYIAALTLMILINLFLLKRIINFNVKALIGKSYLKILLVLLFIHPLFYLRNIISEGFVRFVIISILAVILYLVAVYFIGLERRERSFIIAVFTNITKFKK